MSSHQPAGVSSDFFRQPLIDMINPKHPLVKLAAVIDWDEIGQSFGAHFESRFGRPALSPRLVAGLLYLQHAYDCSDEAVVNTWVENPYFQHFTGETFFQTEAPMDSSSLTRWRKRIGEEGVETMLMATIDAARKRVRSEPGWKVFELATGHDPMVSAPRELAQLLLAIHHQSSRG